MSLTARIELRVSAEDKEAIATAASLDHTTATEFIRRAALDRARTVQARSEHTLMQASQFDALVAALDVPDATPALAREYARPRRFTQH